MSKITKETIAASSATYRTATNEVAGHLKVKPVHTRKPSDDFMRIAQLIDQKAKKRALAFYELGLKRGLRKATDWFADGTIQTKDGSIEAPSKLEITVKIKFSGEDWESHSFKVNTKDIGFK